jgi:NAD(P)-dependent dehydrogenase (short-subunit alcohol dehydrogenase family)
MPSTRARANIIALLWKGAPILSSSGKGEALAKELGGIGVTGSNQSNNDLERLVSQVAKAWGRVDVLVNSAGHGPRDQLLKITDEQWHIGLYTYLMNVVRPTRLVAPIMAAQKEGTIINISTAWAFEPSAMFPTSAVFRAGLAAFTKIFADQYAADNVRMNNVLPGWIDSLPATEERLNNLPMRRYGKSEEIAGQLRFLLRKTLLTLLVKICVSMEGLPAPSRGRGRGSG